MDASPSPTAAAALEAMLGHEAWAVIRLRDSGTVTLVGGTRSEVERLLDVPLEEGVPDAGPALRPAGRDPVPAGRRARLRGPRRRHPADRRRHRAGDRGPARRAARRAARRGDRPSPTGAASTPPTTSTASWSTRSSDDEIGHGEGANLVIGRHYRAQVEDWDAAKALTVLRRLLERERGAYWTYCFFTGDRFLVGASPERHVSVHGGDVRMNPISGTFRLKGLTDDAASARRSCWSSSPTRRRSTSSSWSSTRSSR